MSKTREAFYAGWRACSSSENTDGDVHAAWSRHEQRLASRPTSKQVCERLVVLFFVLAVFGFIVAPLLIKLQRMVQ